MDEAKSKEAGNKIIAMVLDDTRLATLTFRELFERHRSFPLSFEHYTKPDIEIEDLLSSLYLWANVVGHIIAEFNECGTLFEVRHLEAITEIGGLLDLYQDMIMWPGILSEDDVRSQYLGMLFITLRCAHI